MLIFFCVTISPVSNYHVVLNIFLSQDAEIVEDDPDFPFCSTCVETTKWIQKYDEKCEAVCAAVEPILFEPACDKECCQTLCEAEKRKLACREVGYCKPKKTDPPTEAPVLGPMPYCPGPDNKPEEGDGCGRDNQKCGYEYKTCGSECRATETYKCKDGKWKLKKENTPCTGNSCNPCHTGNAPDPNKDCTDIFNVGYKCAGDYEDTSCDGEPAQCTATVDYICQEEGDWKRRHTKHGKSCKWSKSKSSDNGKGGKSSNSKKNSNKNKNSDKNKGPDKGKGGKGPDKGKGKGGNDNDCPAECCGAKVCPKSEKSKGCKSYKSTRRGLRQ